jgi:hypothetical protein
MNFSTTISIEHIKMLRNLGWLLNKEMAKVWNEGVFYCYVRIDEKHAKILKQNSPYSIRYSKKVTSRKQRNYLCHMFPPFPLNFIILYFR